MKEINRDLPPKGFERPQTGLVEATVCSVTGLLPTPYCNEGTTSLLFYEGTQPDKLCDWHSLSAERDRSLIDKLGGQIKSLGGNTGQPIDTTLKVDIPGLNLGVDSSADSAETESSDKPKAQDAQSDILN